MERFFLTEIARFLRCKAKDLRKLLEREGQLRRLQPGHCRRLAYWTTGRGLQIAIAHFRAKQGALYQKGRDPLAELDRNRARRS